jgi:hypothetical protein
MHKHALASGAVVAILAMSLSACPEPAEPAGPSLMDYEIDLAAGLPVRVTLPIDRSLLAEEREGGTRFERDGLMLRIQAVPVTADASERTPASVASAMTRRFELGEQEGELASRPCQYAGSLGQCVIGSFPRDGVPWIRRGAFITAGTQVLWFDVCGPADRVEDVDAWSDELARRGSVRGPT